MTTTLTGREGATAHKARVIVVARTAAAAHGLAESLVRLGHEVHELDSCVTAWETAAAASPDLVLVDADLADSIPSRPTWPTFLLGDAPAANGAFTGTISRTAPPETFGALVAMAVELRQQQLRCRELEAFTAGMRDGSAIAGRSPTIRRLQSVVRRAADCEATVLVEGPAGSGKSLVARVVHCKSRRSHRQITVLLCAETDQEAMTQSLERGRETTLVLEDVDQLSPGAQGVLVRHLKERPQPGAATQPRIIATTAAHLPELVARGAFREDLYYRLHAFPIVVPSLRERPEDVGVIASVILDTCAAQGGTRSAGFTAAALILLESLPWPGNVAQLENVVRRANALAAGGQIDRIHLLGPSTGLSSPPESRLSSTATDTAPEPEEGGEIDEDAIRPFDEEEQRLLGRALRATHGNVRRAAQLLGIGRATLYRKIQQYKLRLQ